MDNMSSQIIPWIVSLVLLTILLTLLIHRLLTARKENPETRNGVLQLGDLQGRLNELTRISGNLEELRSLFVVPYTRGGVGETLLEELLRNWLPEESYALQYGFQNGSRADAIIRLGEYLVAVDAKFPLQSVREALLPPEEDASPRDALQETTKDAPRKIPAQVRRTFLNHARDIAGKYIRPEEHTLQFAMMYIPSEHLYYRCFVEDSGLAEAVLEHKVVPVSPSSLFLYIQTVAYGLRGFNFSQKAEKLLSYLYEIQTELAAFDKAVSTAGTHLKNLTHSFDTISAQSRRIDLLVKRIEKP